MRIAQERQVRYANKKRMDLEFQVSDVVLFHSKILKLKIEGAHKCIRTYLILKRTGPVSCELKLTKDIRIHGIPCQPPWRV